MQDWASASDWPGLAADAVNVWRLQLGEVPPDDAWNCLTEAERSKAADMRSRSRRSEFVQARAMLRGVLGRVLGCEPAAVTFTHSEHGKPGVAGDGVQFNVTHSGRVALLALSAETRVGIDVEDITRAVAFARLAERYFSPAEASALNELADEASRRQAFFRIWTRKEALLKGLGAGLTLGLDRFDVSHDDVPRLVETRFDPTVAAAWQLIELQPLPGYLATLAVEGAPLHVRCWSL